MCFYWKLILDFQVLVLVFIRSIREGNFQRFTMTVSFHGKWYLLWNTFTTVDVTVQCFDLMLLEALCPDVHKEFMAGNFSFQKTNSKFSRLAID